MEYMRWVRRWGEEEEKFRTDRGGFNFSRSVNNFDDLANDIACEVKPFVMCCTNGKNHKSVSIFVLGKSQKYLVPDSLLQEQCTSAFQKTVSYLA